MNRSPVLALFLLAMAWLPCRAWADPFYAAGPFSIRLFSDFSTSMLFATVPSGGSYGEDGIAIDSEGNVYASDSQNGTILKYTAPGTYTVFASGLAQPQGLAFNSKGHLFVVENGPYYVGRVLEFTAPSVSTVFATGLQSAYGIAIDSADTVYVSEYGGGDILQYTASGTPVFYASGLAPASLAIDRNDELYVADYNGDAIRHFTAPNMSTVIGTVSRFPMSVAVEDDGDILAGDWLGLLYEFTPSGGREIHSSGLDQVRAIAVPVPEPSAFALLAVSVLLTGNSRRMRR
jgi:hypothetical protein